MLLKQKYQVWSDCNLASVQCIKWEMQIAFWFGLVSLFNGTSTFVDYLMPKASLQKDSNSII